MNLPYLIYGLVSGEDYLELNLPIVAGFLLLYILALIFRLHSERDAGPMTIPPGRVMRWFLVAVGFAIVMGTLTIKLAILISVYAITMIGFQGVAMLKNANLKAWRVTHSLGSILFLVVIPIGLITIGIYLRFYIETIFGCTGGTMAWILHGRSYIGHKEGFARAKHAGLKAFNESSRHEKVALVAAIVFIGVIPLGFIYSTPVAELHMVPMRDGIKLATIVYRPSIQGGGMPVMLMRTPYDQNNPVFDFQRTALSWCSKGFVAVTQDTRGRFLSEGSWDAMMQAGNDGRDTCEWILSQPWCDGTIGTIGGSAMGMVQLFAAGAGSPGIVAQDIEVGTGDMYDTFYRQGAWAKGDIGTWIAMNGGSEALNDEFLAHPNKTAYWANASLSMGNKYANVNARALHIGGWYDVFSQNSLDAFLGYYYNGTDNARGHQKLVMGPWTHSFGDDTCGQLAFPGAKNNPANRWRDGIFAESLQPHKLTNGLFDAPFIWQESNIAYYVMGDVLDPSCGANGWRYTNDWPISHVDTPLYLQTSKSLAWDAPVAAGNFSYIYDPRHPVQTLGGTNLVFNSTLPYQPDLVQAVSIGAGIWDQRPIHDRSDVLVFNSTLLTQRVEVVGRVTAKLFITSNCTDTDFAVKLCDVYPTGQAMVVCDGIASVRKRQGTDKDLRIIPGMTYEIDVDLWSTAYQFNAGHRIQLVITSSNAPKYNPCPNTGATLNRTYSTFFDANNTILVDPVHPSAAWLPVHRVF